MRRHANLPVVGFTYVRLKISRDHAGARRPIRLLLDTGAFYTMVRRRILEEMGVSPTSREVLYLADGRPIKRDVAEVVVHYRGKSRWTPVVFGERGDASVLGVYTLEGLTLRYDRRTGRLREMKVIPLYGARRGLALSGP